MNNFNLKNILIISIGVPLFAVFFISHSTSKALAVFSNNFLKDFTFNNNLKVGDTGEDVRVLQKVLNSNPKTEVSSGGSGSKDKETLFFGALTKNAVIKFQELYASDILQPFGLKSGTGFVGTSTRFKLNSLISLNNVVGDISEITSLSTPTASLVENSENSSAQTESGDNSISETKTVSKENSSELFLSPNSSDKIVRVYATSKYQASPGDKLILEGEGFTEILNTLHFGNSTSTPNLTSSDGVNLPFVIPKNLPLGKYELFVTNSNGMSKNETIKIYVLVTNNPSEGPTVEKVEPKEITYDSEITVYGKGFTANGNSIYSMFGNVMNLHSPDGKTLKFKPSSMNQMAKIYSEKSAKNMQIEVSFYIANDNGYNKEPASFIIKL